MCLAAFEKGSVRFRPFPLSISSRTTLLFLSGECLYAQRIMSTLDERTAYKNNPYFTGHIYGNFSPFYVTIAVCTVVLGSIIILNIILGCCSKHRQYWQDRHTGNRWLVSIWTATPHKQPPLDFTELKDVSYFQKLQVGIHSNTPIYTFITI